jgi:hypothetical protein
MPKSSPPPAGLTEEYREAVKEWVDRNPLRAWRLAQTPKVGILECAGLVGVGMSMMQMYERGAHKPGPSKHAAVARLLGPDWPEQWDAWLAAKPKP